MDQIKSAVYFYKIWFVLLNPTFCSQFSGDSLNRTCRRGLAAWRGMNRVDKKTLEVLGVSGLFHCSLNFDQVKAGLAQLLQSFVRHLNKQRINVYSFFIIILNKTCEEK